METANLFLIIAIFSSCLCFSLAIPSTLYIPGNTSLSWTNSNISFRETMHFSDGSVVRFILLNIGTINALPGYGFGSCFYCTSIEEDCYFSVVFVERESYSDAVIIDKPPLVVWSANRDSPVQENAMLKLSVGEGLVLIDETGSTVWSTGNSSMSVSGMSITHAGNLILFNRTNGTVWGSFDYPMDTLLVGQTFRKGQILRSRVSPTNIGSGPFFAHMKFQAFSAYFDGYGPFLCMNYIPSFFSGLDDFTLSRMELSRDNLAFFYNQTNATFGFSFPNLAMLQMLKLDQDGGLRIYGWKSEAG